MSQYSSVLKSLIRLFHACQVRNAAQWAVSRARAGEGPTLIECATYRFRGHSLADPDELRPAEQKAEWAAKDPLPAFFKQCVESGIATEEQLKAVEKKVREFDSEMQERGAKLRSLNCTLSSTGGGYCGRLN